MSDHQLIFCTRTVKRIKLNNHNNVFLRSLKHNTVNVFVEKLQKVDFSNYEQFSCIDAAYTDFLNKLMKVVNEIAPSKEIRIKTNTQEWFDREIAELIYAREKLFLKFKKSKLHIDEENYKKVKYQVQNLIRKKKREFYETNLRQKINKPKELWKTLKFMGLPSKAVTASNICLKDKNEIVFNATKNCSISKNYFSSLAHNLVSKLPLAPNIFTESIIASYYDNNTVPKDLDFQLSETSPEKILSILKSLNPSKTAGFDNLSGKFLKDIALMF